MQNFNDDVERISANGTLVLKTDMTRVSLTLETRFIDTQKSTVIYYDQVRSPIWGFIWASETKDPIELYTSHQVRVQVMEEKFELSPRYTEKVFLILLKTPKKVLFLQGFKSKSPKKSPTVLFPSPSHRRRWRWSLMFTSWRKISQFSHSRVSSVSGVQDDWKRQALKSDSLGKKTCSSQVPQVWNCSSQQSSRYTSNTSLRLNRLRIR